MLPMRSVKLCKLPQNLRERQMQPTSSSISSFRIITIMQFSLRKLYLVHRSWAKVSNFHKCKALCKILSYLMLPHLQVIAATAAPVLRSAVKALRAPLAAVLPRSQISPESLPIRFTRDRLRAAPKIKLTTARHRKLAP